MQARFVFGTIGSRERSLAETVTSRKAVSVRLTDEHWTHIAEEHAELSGMRSEVLRTVENPARIYAGKAGELLAAKEIEPGKWLVVVYRELRDDGFVITAFLTRRIATLERRKQPWP